MKLKYIANKTMEKLKNQLLEINDNLKDIVLEEINDYYRKIITKNTLIIKMIKIFKNK